METNATHTPAVECEYCACPGAVATTELVHPLFGALPCCAYCAVEVPKEWAVADAETADELDAAAHEDHLDALAAARRQWVR